LSSSGDWQSTPTWGLTYTDTNNPLTLGGIAGLGRPHGYAGSVSFDNFSFLPASADFTGQAVGRGDVVDVGSGCDVGLVLPLLPLFRLL
jgi:hypothetical protein